MKKGITLKKWQAYLYGITILLFIYLIDQSVFYLLSEKTSGELCEVNRSSGRYGGSLRFYICFKTTKDKTYKFYAGSNLDINSSQVIPVRYLKRSPNIARIDDFYGVWVRHFLNFYLIPLAVIFAFIVAFFMDADYVILFLRPLRVDKVKKGEIEEIPF